MLTQENKIRSVRSISKEKAEEIKDFLQGAIRCYDKVVAGEWFSLRDLMGAASCPF